MNNGFLLLKFSVFNHNCTPFEWYAGRRLVIRQIHSKVIPEITHRKKNILNYWTVFMATKWCVCVWRRVDVR